MEKIDISILKNIPELTEKVVLEIEPLAVLSMVSDLPGSFYKSLKSPSKKMLCGLFENILGWHFSYNDRMAIQKELKKVRKKQKIDFESSQSGSTYVPLLMEYFDIDLVTIPEHFMYNDLWSRSYRRADTAKHVGGTRFMDITFLKKWRHIKLLVENDTDRDSKQKGRIMDFLFKRYIGKFPTFYSTPTNREFSYFKNSILILLNVDSSLFALIASKVEENNITYVGTSEGWVNIKFQKYE